MIYKKPTALSLQRHMDKAWLPAKDLLFASGRQIIPVHLGEIFQAASCLPIAILKDAPVVLTSLARGKNHYITQAGKCRDNFIPAILKCYPFARLKSQSAQPVLCVDEGGEHVVDSGTPGSQPFFTKSSELTQKVKAIMNMLEQLHRDRQICIKACTQLKESGMLVPFSYSLGRKKEQTLKGLYKVDRKALDKDRLDSHALDLAYAQLISMHQIQRLHKLTQTGLKQEKEMEKAWEEGDFELDFGE